MSVFQFFGEVISILIYLKISYKLYLFNGGVNPQFLKFIDHYNFWNLPWHILKYTFLERKWVTESISSIESNPKYRFFEKNHKKSLYFGSKFLWQANKNAVRNAMQESHKFGSMLPHLISSHPPKSFLLTKIMKIVILIQKIILESLPRVNDLWW